MHCAALLYYMSPQGGFCSNTGLSITNLSFHCNYYIVASLKKAALAFYVFTEADRVREYLISNLAFLGFIVTNIDKPDWPLSYSPS